MDYSVVIAERQWTIAALKTQSLNPDGLTPKPDMYYYVLGSWTLFCHHSIVAVMRVSFWPSVRRRSTHETAQWSRTARYNTSSFYLNNVNVSLLGFLLEMLALVDQHYKEGIVTSRNSRSAEIANAAKTIPVIQQQWKCTNGSDKYGNMNWEAERSISFDRSLSNVGEMDCDWGMNVTKSNDSV